MSKNEQKGSPPGLGGLEMGDNDGQKLSERNYTPFLEKLQPPLDNAKYAALVYSLAEYYFDLADQAKGETSGRFLYFFRQALLCLSIGERLLEGGI